MAVAIAGAMAFGFLEAGFKSGDEIAAFGGGLLGFGAKHDFLALGFLFDHLHARFAIGIVLGIGLGVGADRVDELLAVFNPAVVARCLRVRGGDFFGRVDF